MKALPVALASLIAIALPAREALAVSEPLSEASINGATFEDWQRRIEEAKAVAEAARSDITLPPIESEAAPEAEADQSAEVPVTGEPDKVVEAPSYSTDVPDEAGLETADEPETPDPFLVRLQVLMDRAHNSPGVIDGFLGENTKKAIRAYEEARELPVDGEPDADMWAALVADAGAAVRSYEITAEDLSQRYVESIPEDYAELAKMEWLGYHDPAEMLAERFHMDESLLKTLNPQADFSAAGTPILVIDPGEGPAAKVANIVVDKSKGELFAYDGSGALVLSAPATIGSTDTPSPSGTVTVEGSAPDPTYEYDPEKNFKQGGNAGKLTIPPGPNGPVGSVWIDLSKPTYGIHGAADPDFIDKSQSHGCVRLTNWDAEALSKLVEPKRTKVEFRG